jgi:hypothetical protein
MIGPGFTNLDISLEKKTPLWGDKLQMNFRAEAFNVLNHAQFGKPNTSPASGTFGQITSVNSNNPSRIIQLALRFDF